jgi:Na+/H+-dicarboxylate symporter
MSPVETRAEPSRRSSLTIWSLAALGAGLLLGLLGHEAGDSRFEALAALARPIGDLWIAALQMLVLPLMIAYTLAAIVGARGEGVVGVLAGRAVLLFATMLAVAAILMLALAPTIVRLFPADPATIAALKGSIPVPDSVREMAGTGQGSIGSWISSLLPPNIFEAAVRGDILPVLLFTVLLGIAITRLPAGEREPLSRILQGLAGALLVCVRWILTLTPVGVFVLTLQFALGTGGEAAGVLGAWAAISSGLLILCILMLYPVTASLGRTSVLAFARAVAPAQLVAATTRSSIASLPALVQGGREHLRLPDTATGLVLPLGISIFKLSQIVTNMTKFFFLAHVCGVKLTAAKVTAFLVTVMILSFSTAGLPSRGSVRSLPAYLAAGIPIEAVVIVDTVEAIPDIFQTVLNVTGNMSAVTLLSRSNRPIRGETSAAGGPRPARETA